MEHLSLEDNKIYKLGDFELKSGEVLKDAFLAYRTFGEASLPAIVYPTWYSGSTYSIPLLAFKIFQRFNETVFGINN